MKQNNIVDFGSRDAISDPLTEMLQKGAQDLIKLAVEAELEAYMAPFISARTAFGRACVVRNGYHPERSVQTGIGPVSVRIPKVRSKDGTPVTFRSALVPPYVRKTKTLEAAVPWLYLKGVSSGEMGNAVKALLGPNAQGFSANTVSRLKCSLAKEYDGWREEVLDKDDWVYIWADGIHSGLRGEEDKLGFQLREGLFDGVQVRAVRREVKQPAFVVAERFGSFNVFVGCEVVADHDRARIDLLNQYIADI